MNNIKNIIKNIFSAIDNDLFVIINILMGLMLVSIFGFVFMGIWYIIPNCLSSILLFAMLYTVFSASASIVFSIMMIGGFNAWITEKEKK